MRNIQLLSARESDRRARAEPATRECACRRPGSRLGGMARVFLALSAAAVVAACVTEPTVAKMFGIPAWSPDGSGVATHGWLFDARTGASRRLYASDAMRQSLPAPVAFSVDGTLVFSTAGGYTMAWRVDSGKLVWRAQFGSQDESSVVCATPDELVVTSDRMIAIVDPSTGKARAILEAEPYGGVGGVTCSPDGRFLLRAYHEGVVSVWDIGARRNLGIARVSEGEAPLLGALSPEARWLAAWVGKRVLLIPREALTVPGQSRLPDLAIPSATIDVPLEPSKLRVHGRGLAVSPDGKRLALAGMRSGDEARGAVRAAVAVVDVDAKRVRLAPEPGLFFAFSPDGARIVTSMPDFHVWDISAGDFVATLKP